MRALCTVLALVALAGPATGQSLNVDFGEPANGPAATYAAVGTAGVWNSIPAAHGTTTNNLVGLDGLPTNARVTQFGGLQTLTTADPATSGDDALLMDDYLVTFNADLESCLFFNALTPGTYEVLVYARMPDAPDVLSYTSVDQEPGIPHYRVGGAWPGTHAELVTYSRHTAIVGSNGKLDLHSGIVPQMSVQDGAALNGVQIRLLDVFHDGFESGDTNAWSSVLQQ